MHQTTRDILSKAFLEAFQPKFQLLEFIQQQNSKASDTIEKPTNNPLDKIKLDKLKLDNPQNDGNDELQVEPVPQEHVMLLPYSDDMPYICDFSRIEKESVDLLLEENDLKPEYQKIIVERANKLCKSKKIQITLDGRNKCYIVVRCERKKSKNHLLIYSPMDYDNALLLNESDRKQHNHNFSEYFSKNPMDTAEFEFNLLRPKKRENFFVFALGYALSLAIHNAASAFSLGINGDENTAIVREVIVKLLRRNQLPRGFKEKFKIWKNDENHEEFIPNPI